MIFYLDTSSLVKLYVEEDWSADVRRWVDGAEIATSRVAYAEAFAAFARRRSYGDLVAASFEQVVEAFAADWPHVVRLDIDEQRPGQLAIEHLLRGFDAIHLAAALELRDLVGSDSVVFSAFDARLLAAAIREGLKIVHPQGWADQVMESPAPPYRSQPSGTI